MMNKRTPQQILFIGSALLWGMVEFLALQRARRVHGNRVRRPKERERLVPPGRQ